MSIRIYNDEARRDPEKLQEVQRDLLEAAATGEVMIDLASQLLAAGRSLRPGIIPGDEESIARIQGRIYALHRDLENVFGGLSEQAVNLTYLGNLAANRYGVTTDE
ncbi:MAG TPA: hypothetical protein VLF91_00330 [Candidatus Saccharimonadales bacterium]|nr:hypothetical protein [Candidatus Saccharimonadales bacterium]